MSDSSEKMEPPPDASWVKMEPIGWKPPARHRVDPMRPANPRPAEILGHYLQEHNTPELTDSEPDGRPNLWGIVLCVASVVSVVWLVVWGLWLS